jgi:hypothetical protein
MKPGEVMSRLPGTLCSKSVLFLSRRRQGFKSPWGRQKITEGYVGKRNPFLVLGPDAGPCEGPSGLSHAGQRLT